MISQPSGELRSGFTFQRREGLRLHLRPILPQDRWRLSEGFSKLSQESRYFRFYRCRQCLTDQELRYFTEVDQVNHVAWGAFEETDPEMHGLNLGSFIRFAHDAAAAEFAVTVIDAYHYQEIGTVLLAALFLRAEAVGIERLRACVLPENLVALGWLRRLGAETLSCDEYVELELQTRGARQGPREPSRERFDRLLDRIRAVAPAGLLGEGGGEGSGSTAAGARVH